MFEKFFASAMCIKQVFLPGRVAQSVACLATDACLTADPGVASLIPVRSHTFVEIDHEIISTGILLLSADLCINFAEHFQNFIDDTMI